MAREHWFLPETPDVLGMLEQQAEITVEGMDALAAWARGDTEAADHLRATEHAADKKKRELRAALTEAFSTPLDPENLFELSRGLDEVLNGAKNFVGEAEAMNTPPDAAIIEMTDELAAGTRQLAEAFASFAVDDRAAATELADHAIKDQRNLQHSYRAAMSALIENPDLREVSARRELYRRLARGGNELVLVAERVWYSVIKES
jgi:cell fate (sporulation/competence/biofilm development) regulator YlbF (YheA/YmcA/DUF963 family)